MNLSFSNVCITMVLELVSYSNADAALRGFFFRTNQN